MELEKVQRVLGFAAHPVDEILGIGGTITRLSKQGTKVTVAIFSFENDNYSSEQPQENVIEMRKKEARTAAGILGVHESVFLGKSPHNIANDSDVYQQCIRLIRKHRPEIIFNHFQQDKDKDHRTVSEVIDEVSTKAGENILPDLGKPWSTPSLYYYELSELFTHPTDIVDITTTIESKIKAMKTQNSCVAILPKITEYLQALAKIRGHAVEVEYAEAFLISSLTPSKH